MYKVVATVFQQIRTEFDGVDTEEDRIVVILELYCDEFAQGIAQQRLRGTPAG
jgi:hypothetical protein